MLPVKGNLTFVYRLSGLLAGLLLIASLAGGHVGRHAGIGQEARQQGQPVKVSALGGGRQVGGAQVTGEAGGVGGQVAVGYDANVRP